MQRINLIFNQNNHIFIQKLIRYSFDNCPSRSSLCFLHNADYSTTRRQCSWKYWSKRENTVVRSLESKFTAVNKQNSEVHSRSRPTGFGFQTRLRKLRKVLVVTGGKKILSGVKNLFMSRKVAVVTGGNKGIGFEIVRGLCEKFDGDVILTARNVERGQTAVKKLNEAGLKPLFHQLDITDKKSLDAFREYLEENYQRLDVLVNNAAIAFKSAATEPFGLQALQTVHVNYTCLLNTCETLFPLLTANARVVNVSSSAGHLLRIPGQALREQLNSQVLTVDELSDLMESFVDVAQEGKHVQEGWPNSAYSVSKVGVSALSFIQQRLFDKVDRKKNVIVNAVHPGYVKTDMTSHKGQLTPAEGAEAPLYCALLPADALWPRGAFIWWNKRVVDWDAEVKE